MGRPAAGLQSPDGRWRVWGWRQVFDAARAVLEGARVSRVSVTIIAWNEEDRLKACLESVGWADEIIVIDAESTDKTVQVAREFTDEIWVRPWPGFAAQKNFALEVAEGEWILSLDADERVTPELRSRIDAIVRSGRAR